MKPDLCAPGVSVFSAIPTPYVRETGAEPYDRLDGTSMAAPHVSGTAALLWEAFPEASVTQIKQALCSTALRLGSTFQNMHSGHGLIQPLPALRKLEQIVSRSRSKSTKQRSSVVLNKREVIGLPGEIPSKVAIHQ